LGFGKGRGVRLELDEQLLKGTWFQQHQVHPAPKQQPQVPATYQLSLASVLDPHFRSTVNPTHFCAGVSPPVNSQFQSKMCWAALAPIS